MGKFDPIKFEKRIDDLARKKEKFIKKSLQTKPLLKTIPKSPSKKNPLTDGILLFGKHKGSKISELLGGYDTSAYVLEYLANSPDLPKSFRKKINTILENRDPFIDSSIEIKGKPLGIVVKELPFDDDDDIPW